MTELGLVINVIILFFVRIGIPLILLVVLGTVIDRWQSKQRINAHHQSEHSES